MKDRWGEPLVLASTSPRRHRLLEQVGIPFEAAAPDVDEQVPTGAAGEEAVLALARAKADAVSECRPGRWVLGADTLVRSAGLLMGKPEDRADAHRMLTALSGRSHEVLTGVVLVDGRGWRGERVGRTRVLMADLTPGEIDRYVAGLEPYDKAGAYGIQGRGGWLVAAIEGSFSNVMGLPLEEVRLLLQEAGLPLPDLDLPG
jgi:septum formation protein